MTATRRAQRRADDPYARRRARLLRRFRTEGIEALLVTDPQNVRYLSGFTGDDSALLVGAAETALLTDARYTTQAQEELRGVRILCRRKGMMAFAAHAVGALGVKRLGVEAESLTLAEAAALRKELGGAPLVETRRLVQDLRRIKDRAEVALIERAVRIAEQAFERVRPLVRPGVAERALAAELESALLRAGADAAAFRPIVLAGERAALPHGHPSGRSLREGEPVLFDWGARKDLYVSDLTRVLFVHKIPRQLLAMYEAVREAQEDALRRVRPGAAARAVDQAARSALKRHRRAKHFTHSLGHGVGMEVHEAPVVHSRSDERLQPGMVFTVEPGVYYPGQVGIRIEDMVVVTRTGRRILTGLPRRAEENVVRSA